MSAMEPLYMLIGLNPILLSKEEALLLDGIIYERLYEALEEWCYYQYKDYFQLLHIDVKKEKLMFGYNLARTVITDILQTNNYDLSGIACYTDTPEDIVYEIVIGSNQNPSSNFLCRLIVSARSNTPPTLSC